MFLCFTEFIKRKSSRGYVLVEHLKALPALVRVRHTGQVVGIVSVLSIKSSGISVQSFFAIASSLFLCIALFSLDDAHDHISDSIAHPERPIPRGVFTPRQVYLIGAISLCLGVLSASGLTSYQLILFLAAVALGLSVIFLKLKSILRAVLTASMIFVLFPFSTLIGLKSMLFGLIVALPHIAGQIAKDFIHSEGDERIGLKPPPDRVRYVSSFIFFMSGGIILLPIILNLVAWLYIPLILPTLASCLILGSRVLSRQYQKVYIYGGIGMVSALLAFATSI